MAEEQKTRIINLAEKTAPDSGDFFAVDSQAGGSKKIPATALAKAADLTAEAAARTQADNALTGAINSASALIQNPTKTLSGALVSFTDGADMPMVACTASITPKQSGTGTPSPSNVRPISGWESVNLYKSGVNVWDEEVELGGLIWANGQPLPANDRLRSKNFAPCTPNTTYHVFNARAGSVSIAVFFYDASQAFINYTVNTDFTTPSNARYFKLVIQNTTADNHDISINYPSTDHEYHAYNPNSSTTTVNLGRTVYGGEAEIIGGSLTDNKGVVIANGSENWALRSSGTATTVFQLNNATTGTPTQTGEICSHFEFNSQAHIVHESRANTFVQGTSKTLFFQVANSIATTVSEFKAWLAQNPVTVVFDIATPQTYTLTPTEVSTLLGENNVWADSGDVEITYRRDISIVLENLENALNGSNSLNAMMMSAPTENTAEEPTADEAEDDMR